MKSISSPVFCFTKIIQRQYWGSRSQSLADGLSAAIFFAPPPIVIARLREAIPFTVSVTVAQKSKKGFTLQSLTQQPNTKYITLYFDATIFQFALSEITV